MTELEKNTEERILKAATSVFIQKGKAAARMQEIADEAGINKALLHYYYRSKDKLFEAVFSIVVKQLVVPKIIKSLREESDIFKLFRKFADLYIGILSKNPFIPLFILEEINKNPRRIYDALMNSGIPIDTVLSKFKNAMNEGLIRKMDPRHIIVNLISLCVFPFASREIMRPVFFDDDKKAYKEFLESRKKEVADFMINAIKI